MDLFRVLSINVLLLMSAMLGAQEQGFAGWASMEIVSLNDGGMLRGRPVSSADIRFGDLNKDGHNNIIIIKRRQSLLEWLSYVPHDKREHVQAQQNANAIPLSSRLQKHLFRLERLPYDVVVLRPGRIAVLVGPPHFLEIYDFQSGQSEQESWQLVHKIPLLRGDPMSHLPLLYNEDKQQLLMASDKGIQSVMLGDEPRVEWLRPRLETVPRRWFLSDIDGDGDQDLLKVFSGTGESVVWHAYDDGFRPPQAIFDPNVRDVLVLDQEDAASDIYILDAIGDDLLRRYQLGPDKEQRFGMRKSLSLPSAEAAWTGVTINGEPALLVCDTEHPQFLVYPYSKHNWGHAISFPCVDNIEAVYSAPNNAQTVILKRKNEGELFMSTWKDGRFTFPQPWQPQKHQAQSVKILQMGRITNGNETQLWWTQQQDKDLVLFVWSSQAVEPTVYRFADKGHKIEQAIWLGAQRVLCKAQFKRDGFVLRLENTEIIEEKGAHLKNINIDAYRPAYNDQGAVLPVRMQNGVLQWLDEALHASDQVMLDDGLKINDYIMYQGTPFVLESDSMQLISLAKDQGGVLRSDQRYDMPGGFSLRIDPVLGLFVEEPAWICRLDRGHSWALQLAEHVDTEASKAAGVNKQYFHRLHTVEVAGAEQGAFIISDDAQHRLALYKRAADQTKALASWQVFDDGAYPYGEQQRKNVRSEPRHIYAARFDQDQEPDLFLLCHDRLIMYLSEEH